MSLFSFTKHNKMPKIMINGNSIETKFGIKNNDKYIMLIMSICTRLLRLNNLVTCSNQAIDMKIKKISVHDFKI